MKSLSVVALASAVGLFGFAGSALADCNSTQVQDTALTTLLNGKLVCGRPGPGRTTGKPTDRWQEEHLSGGQLWDYKKGVGDKIDPRKEVGSWSVSGTGTATRVNYTYGSTYSYFLSVHQNTGGTYSFCTAPGGSEMVVANIVPNTGSGCGGNYP